MEAGAGSLDIDYILASPFIRDFSDKKKKIGLINIDMEQRTSYLGAPRNSDGSLQTSFYQPPIVTDSDKSKRTNKENEEGAKVRDLSEVSWDPQLEAINDTPTVGLSVPSGNFVTTSSPSIISDGANAAGEVNSNETTKHKKKGRHLSKANVAIQRYTHKVRGATFFGRLSPLGSKESRQFDSENVDHLEDHMNEVCDKAFVEMRTFAASTVALQTMHSSKPGSMQVTTAPEPRDILWPNVYVSKGATRTRSFIGDTLVLILITFYVVPVALVSLLLSESAIVSFSPRLAQLDQASAFFSSAIGMVQPMCLVGIQQVLPVLFIQIGKAEGIVAFSEVQMKAFSRYFLFQVLNIFLVSAIAGSVFDTLAIVIENPESAFEMLGNSLPRMSSFFVTLVVMKTFLGLGMELVRAVSLVQASARYLMFPNSTLRQQRSVRMGMRAIDDPGWFVFHKILAQDMLVVVISVVFAVVAPIVLFPCGLFFLLSRILWTHHHLYIYESVFETGGLFWPKIFRRFVFGLIIAQATITGQFILKEARHQAYATVALMFLTYTFLRKTRARYDGPSSKLPLEVATVMDISVAQEKDYARKRQVLSEDSGREASNDGTCSSVSESDFQKLGTFVGSVDPFEHAYVQPVLRANPRARPEQPFPPSQLGREEFFTGKHDGAISSAFLTTEQKLDQMATVRLKSLNQHDRTRVNQWWDNQIQQAGEQNWFRILIGEEFGTLMIGKPENYALNHGHLV
eukprot:CAMPEP_0194394914 /NCGR_PEP_ID=MMETSP0174-20130528/124122_1 /TAXON_ID=216777 /ORGANISM="Proboscia alata, Strain PI-D3" /LENGTH=740 /DNA_ID=CAMNT_0039190771 /DNA_START=1250 /DNA_END=3472 /DNA_ORIENTATION=-